MSDANAISDLERAEHLGYADGKGVKRVSIFNDGVQVNAATEETLAGLLATKLDDVSTSNITYVGKAAIGSSGASAVWRIMKIDESGTPTTLSITWADSNSNFDNVWDNRTSLTYS